MSAHWLPIRPSRVGILLLILIGLGGATILVGVAIVHSSSIQHLDDHVTSWLLAQRSQPLDQLMRIITWLGSWICLAGLGAVIVALVLTKRLPVAVALGFAIAWAGEEAVVNIAKSVIDRPRPPHAIWLVDAHGGSFPSGHASNASLLFTTLAFLAFLVSERRPFRIAVLALSALGVAAVCFSRVELGVHWTSDVTTSVIVMTAWLASLFGLFEDRHLAERQAAHDELHQG